MITVIITILSIPKMESTGFRADHILAFNFILTSPHDDMNTAMFKISAVKGNKTRQTIVNYRPFNTEQKKEWYSGF